MSTRTLQAVRLYAEAFEDLFAQCCSNPIKNAWGQEVNTTKLNAAHAFASRVLAGQEAPQQPAATQDVLAEADEGRAIMTTDTEALRAQFEPWFSGGFPRSVERNVDGEYTYMPARSAWQAYQAGYAAAKAETAPKPPKCAADDGWQPIETAPKDGSWLHLWRSPATETWQRDPLVIAKWDADQQTWVWPDGPYDVFTERGLRLAEEDLDNCDYYNADEFTHWRPLPKPPTDKGAPDA